MKVVDDGPGNKKMLGSLEDGTTFYDRGGHLCLKLHQQCSEGAIRCGTSNVVVVSLNTNCALQMPRSELVVPVQATVVVNQ